MAAGENPCRECTERQVGCHAVCERYLNWEQAHKAEKERIRKLKEVDYSAYIIGSRNRLKEKIKKRGGH